MKKADRQGIITLEGSYTVKVIGKDGKVKQTVTGKSHSLVRNALRYLFGQLASRNITLKNLVNGDISATFTGTSAISGYKWCYGVGCGESQQAFDIDDYELITKYKDIYSLSITEYIEEDSTGYWDVTGGIAVEDTKTIWEIALYGLININVAVLIARDVLAESVSVTAGDTLAITYKLKTKSV